jgi:hypothetical protein
VVPLVIPSSPNNPPSSLVVETPAPALVTLPVVAPLEKPTKSKNKSTNKPKPVNLKEEPVISVDVPREPPKDPAPNGASSTSPKNNVDATLKPKFGTGQK